MKSWYSAAELVGLPGLAYADVRNVPIRADRERWRSKWVPRRGGKMRVYHLRSLPQETQLALRREPVQTREAKKRREKAERKVQAVAQMIELRRGGATAHDAAAQVAAAYGVDRATIFRWVNRAEGTADRVGALLSADRAECSPEAWDLLRSNYLRAERPNLTACYRIVERVAAEKGWRLPSLSTARRWVRDLDPLVVTLAREGVDGLERCIPTQERDKSVFRALQAVNSDGHRFDFFVAWPNGKVRRPIGVFWQDLYSAKVLAWRIDWTENEDSVRLSFLDMVEAYGAPDEAWMDNGRAFAAKSNTGGVPNRFRFVVQDEEVLGALPSVGVRVHWTKPYHGRSKPIERFFGDFEERLRARPELAGAYTGNTPTSKPENYASKAVPLDTFLRVLKEEVTLHNAQRGRRTKVARGRSFDETFAESYAQGPVRQLTVEQRRTLSLSPVLKTVRPDGTLHHLGNRYWCEDMRLHVGARVILRIDPGALHDPAMVHDLTGELIGEAPCIAAVGFNHTEAARQDARARASRIKAVRAQLEAERTLTAASIAAMLPPVPEAAQPPAPAVANLTRPQLTKPAKRIEAAAVDPERLERGRQVAVDLEERRRARERERLEDDGDVLFARYWELKHSGAAHEPDVARWMAVFETLPEYTSRMRVAEDLGGPLRDIVEGKTKVRVANSDG